MKNMDILIDVNVIMDYLLEREKYFEYAQRLFKYCAESRVNGYVAFHRLSIISYVLRKYPDEERRQALYKITGLLTVVSASHNAVVYAIGDENFSDFEDCLQEKCALQAGADYIVTSNVKDFAASKVPAVTPAEMVELINNS